MERKKPRYPTNIDVKTQEHKHNLSYKYEQKWRYDHIY